MQAGCASWHPSSPQDKLGSDAAALAQPTRPTFAYIAALDGLRGLAILSVIVYHAVASLLPAGFLGVDVFFVISGYLITSLLLVEWNHRRSVGLGRFYIRRALRLLPALVMMLIAYWLANTPLPTQVPRPPFVQAPLDIALVIFYVANWSLALGYGRPVALGHTWSLSIEEQFYLAWPPLLLLMLRRARDLRPIVGVTTVLILAGAFWRVILWSRGASAERLHFGTDTHIDVILFGCLLALALDHDRLSSHLTRIARLPGAGGLALACILLMMLVLDFHSQTTLLYAFVAGAVLTCLVILSILQETPSPVRRLLETSWLVYLGKISYGLYLWHYPVFIYLKSLRMWGPYVLMIGGALSIFIAALSYRYIERPFLKLKPR